MGSIQNMVYYCCVAKGNRILYAYSCGDPEIDKLAVLCLERAPPFHTWYFQSVRKKTYGFLMEDGYIYFSIVDESLGNPGVLQFLEHVRNEFKKLAKSSSRGSISGLNSDRFQEQLVPVIRRLINSLEKVSQPQSDGDWMPEIPTSQHPGPSPSPESGQTEVATSTKAPLLGKFSKQEKKKMKDRVIEVRDNGSEEHRKSTDREVRDDVSTIESDNHGVVVSSFSVQKGSSSMSITADPQHARDRWRRQVRIVIALDVLVCLILFALWLGICGGFRCISG
ncbi:phytolongin Phyl1.1-like [Telopea speciosissima]|uniref:phytolongin Phyl1.1-like n=1 Tax=Telopea speciosissima TaxID=54955 RepID=UPI001CC76AB6|nr:phytolongin Phyl1.1-like [Telopea speciosissima]